MWESPSEYDYGYTQYDPDLYNHDTHNRCDRCGRIIGYTAGKYCDKCRPHRLVGYWQFIVSMFKGE